MITDIALFQRQKYHLDNNNYRVFKIAPGYYALVTDDELYGRFILIATNRVRTDFPISDKFSAILSILADYYNRISLIYYYKDYPDEEYDRIIEILNNYELI